MGCIIFCNAWPSNIHQTKQLYFIYVLCLVIHSQHSDKHLLKYKKCYLSLNSYNDVVYWEDDSEKKLFI